MFEPAEKGTGYRLFFDGGGVNLDKCEFVALIDEKDEHKATFKVQID